MEDSKEESSEESDVQDDQSITSQSNIRRSSRDPSVSFLDKLEVKKLIGNIQNNHPSTVILKLKNHLIADINFAVIEAVITALWENTSCQVRDYFVFTNKNRFLILNLFIPRLYISKIYPKQ
jgi:hypothetical protein